MDNAVTGNYHRLSSPLFSRQLFPVHPRHFGAKGPAFRHRFHCRLLLQPSRAVSGGSVPSPASTWGGWEDLTMQDDPDSLGYVDFVRRFLASAGLHGKEQAFLFCIGFLSALAISRVRLSVMTILPASAVLFAAGVFVGVAQGGASLADLLERGGRGKDSEKVGFIVAFLDDLDSKMADLKTGLEAMKSNRLDTSEVKRYLGVVESIRSAALPAKKFVVEELSDGWSSTDEPPAIEGAELERKTSQKGSYRKRKDVAELGYDVTRFLRGLLQESFLSMKNSKAKDNEKKETTVHTNTCDKDQSGSLQQNSCVADMLEDNASGLIPTGFEESAKAPALTIGAAGKTISNWDSSPERERGKPQIMAEDFEDEKRSGTSSYITAKKQDSSSSSSDISDMVDEDDHLLLRKEYGHFDRTFHLNSRNRTFERSVFHYKSRRNEINLMQNKVGKSSGREMNLSSRESDEWHTLSERESSMHSDSIFDVRDKTFSDKMAGIRKNTGSSGTRKVSEIKSMDDQKQHKSSVEINVASSSAMTADDEFHQNLKDAGDLLKQAREHLKREDDEEMAEIILYRSARLLSIAVALKPMSLLAVGQLGNTFLLHGELKLKTTRELRILLSENDNLSIGRKNRSDLKALVKPHLNKDAVLSVLVDTCEECEELLVDAGRMYKKALTIDNNDIRALYNWGLALSYRAQLIGDIGPEAAIDADKIYLAAIDKFAAMTSRGNKYAPDALFRWALALQERSHLHRYDVKLKMKYLRQAKSMYEDVLRVDRNNPVVREALFSCISELNLSRQLK